MSSEKVPIGENEIIERAVERAKFALKTEKANLGVGFSEGIIKNSKGIFTAAWCAIVTPNNELYLGGGLQIQITGSLLEKAKAGSLRESEIEQYLQTIFENPFERLVQYAAINMETKAEN